MSTSVWQVRVRGAGYLSLTCTFPSCPCPSSVNNRDRALAPVGCPHLHSLTITFSIILWLEMNTAGRKLHETARGQEQTQHHVLFEISCCQSRFTDEEPKVQKGRVTFPSSCRYVVAEPGMGTGVLSWDVDSFTFIHFLVVYVVLSQRKMSWGSTMVRCSDGKRTEL